MSNNKSQRRATMGTKQIQYITVTAVLSALVTIMTFIPALGYPPLGFVEATTLHIVTILAGILLGLKGGTIVGTVWGVTCIIYAFMRGGPALIIFQNPLVSVVPRIFVGFLVPVYFMIFSKLFSKFGKNKRTSKNASIIATAVLGTLTNTVLVLSAMMIFSASISDFLKGVFTLAILGNIVFEIIIAVILVPALAAPLKDMVDRNMMKPKEAKSA